MNFTTGQSFYVPGLGQIGPDPNGSSYRFEFRCCNRPNFTPSLTGEVNGDSSFSFHSVKKVVDTYKPFEVF